MPMIRRAGPPGIGEGRGTGDHPGLGAAGHRADDDRVEEDAELALLVGDLVGPVRVPEAAERVIRRPGRDRVRLAASIADLGQRLLPALLEPDPEAGLDQPDVRADQAADEDVADPVIDRVRPVHPALLDEDAAEADVRRDRGDLAGVVGLDAADRDERVAAGRQRVSDQVLELAGLVAAERDARVAVVSFRPDRGAAEMLREPAERLDRRRAEQQRIPGERADRHGVLRRGLGWTDAHCRSPERLRSGDARDPPRARSRINDRGTPRTAFDT